MNAQSGVGPFNSWETVRYELLNMRICDLGLKIEGSRLQPMIRRLHRELSTRRLGFRPEAYLTDSWGCPDEVPIIGIPFYLADARLTRIEQEQTGEAEDSETVMMFLRHEAGHAFNYAYRLWEDPEWRKVFGPFSKPYRDAFVPQPHTRDFVRHLFTLHHGHAYAQKHPDEDFAETFAVWLTPGSAWRRRYRNWSVIHKLIYVDRLMRRIGRREPLCAGGKRLNPLESIAITLAQHYGQRVERYRSTAQGYIDDRLREIFPKLPGPGGRPMLPILRQYHPELLTRLTRWSGLEESEVNTILAKLEQRTAALRIKCDPNRYDEALLDIGALATVLAMEFAYTGRVLD